MLCLLDSAAEWFSLDRYFFQFKISFRNSNKYSLIFNWKCWLKVKSNNTENCKNKSYLFESVIYLFAFVFIFERVFANKRVAWRNTDGRYKKCLGKSRSSHLISSSSIKSSPNINSYVNSTFWVRPKLVCGSTKSPCKKYRLKRTQKNRIRTEIQEPYGTADIILDSGHFDQK